MEEVEEVEQVPKRCLMDSLSSTEQAAGFLLPANRKLKFQRNPRIMGWYISTEFVEMRVVNARLA